MAVKIGHASIDENGKAAGGKAGDQTKKEVCTRTWYNGSWNVVLRPKSATVAEKSAKACEDACANPNIGYDQGGRNTLYKLALVVAFVLSKIKEKCECDCSTLMHVCAIAAGVKLSYGSNGLTTRTMRKAFLATGQYEELTDKKYLTSDAYLKRGDILLKEGTHTAMVLENGSKIGASTTTTTTTAKVNKDVQNWQKSAIADGFTFPKYGADGDWGAECEAVAKKAIVMKRTTYKYKNLTKIVQKAVGVTTDGLCGAKTDAAIKEYQRKNGLTADGQVGLKTWKKILKV